MILAQKQTHSSTEQNRKPRNKPRPQDQLIYDKGGKKVQGEKTVTLISGAGETGQLHVKE